MVVAAVAMTACSRQEIMPETDGAQLTVTAYHEGASDTRTTVQDGGTQVLWEPAEEIKLFYQGGEGRFVSQNTQPAAVADFSGVLDIFPGIGNTSDILWGIYPYRADASSDGESVTTTLPAQQTGRAGSFERNTHITLARSYSYELAFFNVTGGLRFSLTQTGIKSVTFQGNGGEALAGTVKLAFENGVPAVQQLTGGESVITLAAPDGGTFQTGKWYYIEAIPGTLSGGFKLTFYKDGESATLGSAGSVTIHRGKYGSLADADEGLVFQPVVDPSAAIKFEDLNTKNACVSLFDSNGDGEVSYAEAAAATSLKGLFSLYTEVKKFDEIKYFTGVSSTDGVFTGLRYLESITIPGNITTLGTFKRCIALKTVVLPSGLKSLPNDCFDGCKALTDVTLPTAITTIPDYCFQNCRNLVTLDLPAAVTAINQYAFKDCSSLSGLVLPSGLKTIEQAAFGNCSSLGAISLPSGLTSLGDNVFSGCSSLTTVTIPAGCSVGTFAFRNCSSLESVVLPSDLSVIPSTCFFNCGSLKTITWPSVSALTIDEYAFSGCLFKDADNTLRLPENVKQIGQYALSGVQHLIIPSPSAVDIEASAFGDDNYRKFIYVPAAMVGMYKARTNWSYYADCIHSISEYPCESGVGGKVGTAVDLGLSVKWASWNVGASSPEEYGEFFAWGGIQPKYNFSWDTYEWGNGEYGALTKYNTASLIGIVDNKTVLESGDDAAHVHWGGAWRMPTYDELNELKSSCTWTWTTQNGNDGMLVTGPNGKSIFLPAAGYRSSSSTVYPGSYGFYWSSSLSTPHNDRGAHIIYFASNGASLADFIDRASGLTVRPVTE